MDGLRRDPGRDLSFNNEGGGGHSKRRAPQWCMHDVEPWQSLPREQRDQVNLWSKGDKRRRHRKVCAIDCRDTWEPGPAGFWKPRVESCTEFEKQQGPAKLNCHEGSDVGKARKVGDKPSSRI